MEHVSVEKIIEFVSVDRLSESDLALTREVNAHLCDCADCRRRVRAAQTVYDALLAECKTREAAKKRLSRELDETLERKI
ncbi:MAG: hypothetical protein IJX64_02765 [Clostridia bacterium]|nr:hypothetical protein [Clostridia bacterium]